MPYHRLSLLLTILFSPLLSRAEQEHHSGGSLQTGFPGPAMTVAFPKAYLDAEISKLLRKGHHAPGLGCNSLMGPTCFYTGFQEANVVPETRNASGFPECSSQPVAHLRDSEEKTAAMQQSTGIMAQYLEASHSQLGAVHGHSSSLSKHWQQIGAAREDKLDDVVYVRVGRGGSVQSVYDSNQSIRRNSEKGIPEICRSGDKDELQNSSSDVQ